MTTRLGTRGTHLLLALAIAVATTAGPAGAQTVPEMPAPVAVSLAPATTALLVMDVIAPICNAQQPNCLAMVPRVANLIAAARKAGVWVLYSAAAPAGLVAPVASPPFLAAIAPQSGDPVVLGAGQDRFYSTALDGLLRAHGITTLILAGWRENGSVLYTAVGANLHGYTAVVAEDSTSATTPYDIAIGRYQLLTQLSNNAKNEPLKKGTVTLSRGDLITFR
jgi:nicotinamidase-related amidase